MSESPKNSYSEKPTKRILLETLIVMAVTVSSAFVPGALKYVAELPALIYLLVERQIRGRSLQELGFKLKKIPHDLTSNWRLIGLVAVVFQVIPLLIGKYWFPDYIAHIRFRMPTTVGAMSIHKVVIVIVAAILMDAVISLFEELIYRGFFLERLSWFLNPLAAIVLSTLFFAAMHFAQGSIAVVLFDLATVLADGIVYGIIYYRTKNIYASFIAHFLANLIGVILLLHFC